MTADGQLNGRVNDTCHLNHPRWRLISSYYPLLIGGRRRCAAKEMCQTSSSCSKFDSSPDSSNKIERGGQDLQLN